MSDTTSNLNSKYAWCELDTQTRPKRSATERVTDFLEIYALYDEKTAREQASRCVQCPEPVCVEGCPVDNPIPDWILLTAEGKFLEASTLLRTSLTMPEICSRVCPSEKLCEDRCIVGEKGDPVSIGAIERFLNDYALAHGIPEATSAPPSGKSVAVVGSGPGGLMCADELARRGHAVTVFAARLMPGGLLVNGLPAFTLEKSIVQRRVEMLEKRGVVFRLGTQIGEDITLSELQARFDAVYLGFDAQKSRTLDVPGGDLHNVIQALPFIIQKSASVRLEIPPIEVKNKRVVVLGGGDTAMDCARTAIRCGAREVVCVYRRDQTNMPCVPREYQNAIEEGVQFVFLSAPVAVLGDTENRVAGLRLIRTQLTERDANGRAGFEPVQETEFEMETDFVFLALGFDAVPFKHWEDFYSASPNEWGGIQVDSNQMTGVSGIFAGGDIVRGPSLVMHAVRDARQAAAAIHSYLTETKLEPQPVSVG